MYYCIRPHTLTELKQPDTKHREVLDRIHEISTNYRQIADLRLYNLEGLRDADIAKLGYLEIPLQRINLYKGAGIAFSLLQGIIVIVDAAQSIGHTNIDVQDFDINLILN